MAARPQVPATDVIGPWTLGLVGPSLRPTGAESTVTHILNGRKVERGPGDIRG